jgi:hypothetical protein
MILQRRVIKHMAYTIADIFLRPFFKNQQIASEVTYASFHRWHNVTYFGPLRASNLNPPRSEVL